MADPADRRYRDLALAGQILAGDAVRVGHDRLGRAFGDDMPAMDPGARPHIDDPVGGADRLLVVLDDDDGVAEVAQPLQGREQAPVVALVQADRRLVEHIEDPGQPGADLRGQPDALALAAGERAGGARQGQVFEPDILQKAETLVDLLQDALSDLALARGQLGADAGKPGAGLGDRHRRDLADVLAGDLDGERLGLEPVAAAHLAGLGALIAPELLLDPGAVGLAEAPLHIRQHALERSVGRVFAQPVVIGHLDRLAVGAVEDRAPHLFRQILPRRMHALAEVPRNALQGLRVILRARMRPWADCALGKAAPRVVHDQIGVEIELGAEPVAGWTGAERVVERKKPRLDLGDRKAGDRAGEFCREDRLLAGIRVFGDRDAVGQLERGLERIGEAVAELAIDDDAVDDDLDVVLEVLVEPAHLVELEHFAVDLDPLKAAPLQFGQFLAIFALASAHDRREQVEPGALRHRQHAVYHLRHGLADDRQAGRGRVGNSDPRP